TQICVNRRDIVDSAVYEYELFLRQKGIKHVLCRANHLQTKGKLEKFHDLYSVHRLRWLFGCFCVLV
ncbi:MAG: hypothetical protein LBC12_07810, partial [Nitrososphaerota archaeon]|nr:hypothetical protein [Nitrososphaerota archaeon]